MSTMAPVGPRLRLLNFIRTFSNNDIAPVLTNRNPRNLERLRIAYKPGGYYVDRPGRSYWHRLQVKQSARHVTAALEHYERGKVFEVSTKEWAIKKHLYKMTDTAAYINLARVFVQRCLESGLTEMHCDIQPENEDGKLANFLRVLRENGIALTEPQQYTTERRWKEPPPEKPWEVTE